MSFPIFKRVLFQKTYNYVSLPKAKKILKICGGLLGVGAIACIIPACVVSCGSSNSTTTSSSPASPTTTTSNSKTTSTQQATPTTSTNQPTKNTTPTSSPKTDGTTTKAPTQSSSTKKVSEPNTPTPSYLKTNPYYMASPYSDTSTLVSEPTTASPLEFYLGGSSTPNTSIQVSHNTYNINLQLNPTGQSDEGTVLSSYKTSPTLLAIVPTNTLTTNFNSTKPNSALTFTKSSPLLLQTSWIEPFLTNNKTVNTNMTNVSVNMWVSDGSKALTTIGLPVESKNGELDFGLTSETFTVDVNNTRYTINLEVNFSPYLVQATTPLTASDFNLNTTMPGAPSKRKGYFNYHAGETYREFYIHNSNYHQNYPDWMLGGVPAPTPTLPNGYNV